MAKKTYTKTDLSKAASQAKRQIINKFKQGTQIKITKTEAFNIISRKLKLKSSRTLWLGDTRNYLDEWFSKLEDNIKEYLSDTQNKEQNLSTPSLSDELDVQELISKLNKKSILIKEYEKSIKTLREENENLRLLVIEKHGKIDL